MCDWFLFLIKKMIENHVFVTIILNDCIHDMQPNYNQQMILVWNQKWNNFNYKNDIAHWTKASSLLKDEIIHNVHWLYPLHLNYDNMDIKCHYFIGFIKSNNRSFNIYSNASKFNHQIIIEVHVIHLFSSLIKVVML